EVLITSRKTSTDEKVLPLDLSQPPESWPALPECRAAVFCAAMTNLEQCRRDPAESRRINVVQTLHLARRLAEQNCFVVFISTNLVFDGAKPFRRQDDPTCPRTEYGRQKAEVEAALAGLGERA